MADEPEAAEVLTSARLDQVMSTTMGTGPLHDCPVAAIPKGTYWRCCGQVGSARLLWQCCVRLRQGQML